MTRIGIIGAENSHCAAIAKLCNIAQQVGDARVVTVWGEKPQYAQEAAAAGQIPEIVADWEQMLGKVDGVMIDHRHPAPHAEVARFFLKKRVPTFVDKPFTYTVREARALCALARKTGTPLTSFSVIPLEQGFQSFKTACQAAGKIAHLNTVGPADLDSQYGGVFFYGVHQVDAVVELLGPDIQSVQVIRRPQGGVAILTAGSGATVSVHLVNNGCHVFHWTAVCDKEVIAAQHQRDQTPYLQGARRFVEMFRTRQEPFSYERMIAPIAILEAMAKSLKTGRIVKVQPVAAEAVA